MDISEAYRITKEFQSKSVLDPDEEFMLIEAYLYIIRTYEDAEDAADGYVAMYNLASYYKRTGEYSLALKYFLMCSEHGGGMVADMEIGDIYYYGLTGAPDFAKAFQFYSSSARHDFPKAKLMLAYMYDKGQYVAQDHQRYRELIFEVFDQICDSPVPDFKGEVFFRAAEICLEDCNPNGAFELLLSAQDHLTDQLKRYTQNSDLDLMREIVETEYNLMQVDLSEIDLFGLYDLYFILKQPVSVEFTSSYGTHLVSSFLEHGNIIVNFDGKWFRSIDEFFYSATIAGERLPAVCEDLLEFRVI